jgi:hypothetical protein
MRACSATAEVSAPSRRGRGRSTRMSSAIPPSRTTSTRSASATASATWWVISMVVKPCSPQSRRLAPGQVLVDGTGRNRCLGRTIPRNRAADAAPAPAGTTVARLRGECACPPSSPSRRPAVALKTGRNSRVISCRSARLKQIPSPLFSTRSPPVTTLISKRPPTDGRALPGGGQARLATADGGRSHDRDRAGQVGAGSPLNHPGVDEDKVVRIGFQKYGTLGTAGISARRSAAAPRKW